MTPYPIAVRIEPCGPRHAEVVHRLTQAAFREQAALDPPSGAASETVETVREELAKFEGAIGWLGDRPVACLRMVPEGARLHVRRLAVAPDLQGKGIGRAMMTWAELATARMGLIELTVGVRIALPGNRAFYERLGYEVLGRHAHVGYARPTWIEMRKRVRSG